MRPATHTKPGGYCALISVRNAKDAWLSAGGEDIPRSWTAAWKYAITSGLLPKQSLNSWNFRNTNRTCAPFLRPKNSGNGITGFICERSSTIQSTASYETRARIGIPSFARGAKRHWIYAVYFIPDV